MARLKKIAAVSSALMLVAILGCEQKQSGGTEAPEAAKAAAGKTGEAAKTEEKPAEPAKAAAGTNTLKGSIVFDGEAPAREKLKREADPFCAQEEMQSETVLVKDGKLQNVVVRITGGGLAAKAAAGDVKVDQSSCMYRPRVQCATVGQKIVITNSDKTMHNVHGYKADGKTWFNTAQMGGAPPMKKDAKNGGELLTFKCDVHPWMAGYVFVSENGYCAVSGEDGSFAIDGLPAGKYTVTAWHEVYGEKTAEVTVADGAEAKVDLTYSAADKS